MSDGNDNVKPIASRGTRDDSSFPPSNSPPIVVLFGFTGASVLLNILLLRAAIEFSSPTIGGFLAGGVMAEFAVFSVWAVFGPQALPIRWFAVLLATAMLYGSILIGIEVPRGAMEAAGRAMFAIPLVSLAAQLPMWILKLLVGVRLVGNLAEQNESVGRPLRIHDLMYGTAFIAVSLGLVRFAGGNESPMAVWTSLGISCGVVACIGVLFLPALWACLTRLSAGAGAIAVFAFATLLGCIVIMVVAATASNAPPPDTIGLILGIAEGAALITVGGLMMFRMAGMRLGRPRSPV